MRAFQFIPAAVSTLTLLLAQSHLVGATPFSLEGGGDLEKRCSTYCGYYSQLCCADGESCITDSNGEAVCQSGGSGSGSNSASWEYYTTTYVVTETDLATITSTWSSQITATPTGSSGSCKEEFGETKCGDVCCGAAYQCSDNKCIAESSSVLATATPPLRGTSDSTVTQTSAPTTTQGFVAPVNTDGSTAIGVKASDNDGGLSGGAIAGIVIGVIAGVALLLLLCAFLCCRGPLLACCGGRRRKETTYVDDRYSHHHHGAAAPAPAPGRTWFGSRPAKPDTGEKKSKWSSLATIGLVLGAIALCLGLKRRRNNDDEKSDYTYPSSYYYSDYYTNSSVSSDRRTRDTRRTADTRRTRDTRRSGRTRSSRTNSRR
ncbi:hypothetical protein ASPWEDRAFT_166560 [Aspergillus wentii DTO 134E9]|uniref:Gram-positive cocci surface proteins LPxTG domain-containing protein n=1 Tax=Aspergillus wentii DTO 134E9 TaxID=1073089 RepID=A0A1L9RZZ8_ASPWE|nr:uncharacterized protein ASPWEDRAFT_166560 [Aspergillus wentii DTO 134E9]KAI9932909.1 hypothetical protein MW887_009161 [Aspergillus wentii]OJJ40495.1 hypothetical protein ASPWEDRAFT_166560 [Aspergillus wentii DTO 134E9]